MDFFENNSLYIVLGIVIIIWAGLSYYLFSVDKKISRVEKSLEN